jgi:hypothetical protein
VGPQPKISLKECSSKPSNEGLDDWLHELGVTVVAMESTGVFWHPIFNILAPGSSET